MDAHIVFALRTATCVVGKLSHDIELQVTSKQSAARAAHNIWSDCLEYL